MRNGLIICIGIGFALAACGRTANGVSAAPAQTAGIAPIDLIGCSDREDTSGANDTAQVIACAKQHAAQRPAPTAAEEASKLAAAQESAAAAEDSAAEAERAASAERSAGETVASPVASRDGDTITYDPAKSRATELARGRQALVSNCIGQAVRTELARGVHSRAAIKNYARVCGTPLLGDREITFSTDDAQVDAMTDNWIATLVAEAPQ